MSARGCVINLEFIHDCECVRSLSAAVCAQVYVALMIRVYSYEFLVWSECEDVRGFQESYAGCYNFSLFALALGDWPLPVSRVKKLN